MSGRTAPHSDTTLKQEVCSVPLHEVSSKALKIISKSTALVRRCTLQHMFDAFDGRKTYQKDQGTYYVSQHAPGQ